jgi:hypothetical protein
MGKGKKKGKGKERGGGREFISIFLFTSQFPFIFLPIKDLEK